MEAPKPKIVPLEDWERDWLMKIYTLRKKDLFFAGCRRALFYYFIAFCLGMYMVAILHDAFIDGENIWFDYPFFFNGWWWKSVVIVLLTAANCALRYYAWIVPMKKDADSGFKALAPFTVTRKEYYPVTGQYFLHLAGRPKRFEVDDETYNEHEEGETIYMRMAVNSAHIFSFHDSVTVRVFDIKRPTGFPSGSGR